MKPFDNVLVEADRSLVLINLNRPEKRNALTGAMMNELRLAVDAPLVIIFNRHMRDFLVR